MPATPTSDRIGRPLLGACLTLACLVGIAVPRARGQEEPPPTLAEPLEALRSDDIVRREAAQRQLGEMPLRWLPALHCLRASEADPEAKARLAEVVRVLARREAERLVREGNLDGALESLARAEGPRDPQEMIREAKREVREEIRSWFPEQPCMDDLPKDFAETARSIEERFGPWGLAVLIDALAADDPAGIPAVALLQELGDDILPCLIQALRTRGLVTRREVCSVLYARASFGQTFLEDDSALRLALEAARSDPLADPGTRIRIDLIKQRLNQGMRDRLLPNMPGP